MNETSNQQNMKQINNDSNKPKTRNNINKKKSSGFSKGIVALREVARASKALASAQKDFDKIAQNLKSNEEIYSYRHNVEMQITQIQAEGNAILAQTNAGMQQTQGVISSVEAEVAKLNEHLAQVKYQNEQALRPYKQLSTSAQGHLSDTSRALSDAKRNKKSAEEALKQATDRRNERVAIANEAIDNSYSRIKKLELELNQESTSSKATLDINEAILNEKRHLGQAKEDLAAVNEQAQLEIENAQGYLLAQKNTLKSAELENNIAKESAQAKQKEYQKLLSQAEKQEADIQEQITIKQTRLGELNDELEAFKQKYDKTYAKLEEAAEIVSTPEKTREFANMIKEDRQRLNYKKQQIAHLKQKEEYLRNKTRKDRIIVIVVLVLIVVAILSILYFSKNPIF